MGTAAKISIAIEAQTATLQRGFDEAKSAIKSLDSNMGMSVAKGMAIYNAGLVAVKAVLGSVKLAFQSVMSAMDEMGKMDEFASRLGMDADALTVLGFAAEQTGASQETMNMALQKMQNRIGEAAAGSKEAAKAFGQLGLGIGQLLGMSPDEQFAAIADKMQGIGTATQRTQVTLDVFGKSGGELNNLLAEGAEGLQRYGAEADHLGLLMGNDRAAVEAAGDAINSMKRAWGAFVQEIAIAVAPALGEISTALASIIGQFNDLMGNKHTKLVGSEKFKRKRAAQEELAAAEMKKAEDAAAVAEKKMQARAEAITSSVMTPLETYSAAMKELDELVKAGAISWDTYRRSAEETAEALKKSNKVMQEIAAPGVGAVTMGTVAGFSAVQEANRARQDAERRHRDLTAWLAKINADQAKQTLILAPVNL